MFELKAPQKPLLEATAITKTFFTGLFNDKKEIVELEITLEKLDMSSLSFSEYGLIAIIASCAFLSLAAETILIALVIFIVEVTEEILFLISFKFAINLFV